MPCSAVIIISCYIISIRRANVHVKNRHLHHCFFINEKLRRTYHKDESRIFNPSDDIFIDKICYITSYEAHHKILIFFLIHSPCTWFCLESYLNDSYRLSSVRCFQFERPSRQTYIRLYDGKDELVEKIDASDVTSVVMDFTEKKLQFSTSTSLIEKEEYYFLLDFGKFL